jgi:hypothetical protein
MCYQCCGYFHGDDPKTYCEIDECPLSGWMPYQSVKEKVKTVWSEKQIEASRKLSLLRSGSSKTNELQA